MRFLLVLLAAAFLSGCATRPTVYKAPDASKVTATTKRLSAAIAKADETTLRVEAKAQEAQQSEDRIAGHSASVLSLISELEPFIPAEQRPKFAELKASANAQIVEEGKLSAIQASERGEIDQLKKDQAVVVQEKDQLKIDQAKYQEDAAGVARNATTESAQKAGDIDALKRQLTSQKILGWLWKLGGGAVVIAIIALVVLWWTGRIAFNVSKGVAKL